MCQPALNVAKPIKKILDPPLPSVTVVCYTIYFSKSYCFIYFTVER